MTPTKQRLEALDIAMEFRNRGLQLPEDLLERIDGMYMQGFKDGVQRGMYEQQQQEDAECVPKNS